MSDVTKATPLWEILERYPVARQVFDRHGLHGCRRERGPAESLEFFARVHEADVDTRLEEIQKVVAAATALPGSQFGPRSCLAGEAGGD